MVSLLSDCEMVVSVVTDTNIPMGTSHPQPAASLMGDVSTMMPIQTTAPIAPAVLFTNMGTPT